MAGKKGMKGGGGARSGAGRKAHVPDAAWREELESAMRAAAEAQGKTPAQILAERCMAQDGDAPKYWKLYMDYTKVKETKQTIDKTVTERRAIILPAMNPDPAEKKDVQH